MSICQQVLYICFQFPYSIATAGNIHVGQLLGSNSPHKAKNAAKVLVVISGKFPVIDCSFKLNFSSLWHLSF